jgi:arylsulfatase A-like enzyme
MCGDWPLLRSDIGEARPGGQPGRCLPDLLRDLGYSTGFFQTANEAFESRAALVHNFGFQFFRGRDSLLASPRSSAFAKVNYFGLEDRAMLAPSVDWATRQDSPFFAAYLTLATHHDYGVLADWSYPPIPGKKGRELHYLGNVRYSDDFVKRLVASYTRQGLAANTVFIVLGDHGEAFGEHGRYVHDMVIYDEGLHIPLVMWGPGIPTGVIEGDRQQIDVLPTVVQLAGGALSGSVRGSTLLDPAPERDLHHSCWRSHRCLAERDAARVKTIDLYGDGPMQVFDVAKDPTEQVNLASTVTDKPARRAALRDWRAAVNGRYDEMSERWVNADQRPDSTPAQHHWRGMDLIRCEPDQAYAVPGQTFWVDCTWRPDADLGAASLRVRFRGVESTVRPLTNVWPTWNWRPGWSIDDSFPVLVPAETTPGEVPIEVSWDGEDWVQVGAMPIILD